MYELVLKIHFLIVDSFESPRLKKFLLIFAHEKIHLYQKEKIHLAIVAVRTTKDSRENSANDTLTQRIR